jgi:hypothetical protein
MLLLNVGTLPEDRIIFLLKVGTVPEESSVMLLSNVVLSQKIGKYSF